MSFIYTVFTQFSLIFDDLSLLLGFMPGGKGGCHGDSGGPLVVEDPANNYALTLAGTLSDEFPKSTPIAYS